MKGIYKQTFLLTGLLISTLAISPTVLAETQNSATEKSAEKKITTTPPATKETGEKKVISKNQDQANQQAIKEKEKAQTDLLEDVNKGINEGFDKVVEASKLIEKGKEKEAIKALEAATGKFDIALAADPKLGLIPIYANVKVTQLLTTPDAVKAQLSLAKDLLSASKVQAARAILLPLKDDLETRTVYLPMTTYPDAIKLATKMLIEGNNKAAVRTLATALSTLVEKISVTPLSLIRVESIVKSAIELDKDKAKDKAMALLDTAEEQLQLALLLGYTNKQSALYEDLSTQIRALQKEAKGANVVEKLYSKLSESIKSLLNKNMEQTEKKADN